MCMGDPRENGRYHGNIQETPLQRITRIAGSGTIINQTAIDEARSTVKKSWSGMNGVAKSELGRARRTLLVTKYLIPEHKAVVSAGETIIVDMNGRSFLLGNGVK